jgi:hypothetical protein
VQDPVSRALAYVSARSSGDVLDRGLRVTLNFHPDRLSGGRPVLERLAADGVYRSQFETGTSNGGLTAHPGGSRWRWESRIFGGAYDEAPAALRPKYGALNHRRRPAGGAPRFGSAHLRLAPHTLERTTFCFPDSVFEPTEFGVATAFRLAEIADAAGHDPLDAYVEAHVHGVVDLARDVEALVLDPSYRGTDVETRARAVGCPVEWHGGFRIHPEDLVGREDYRGPQYVALAATVAAGGVLTPRVIGDASRTGRHDEQDLKRVWHLLARYGDLTPEA